LTSSDFFQLCTLDFIQKLQKKKSVSNGNEYKKVHAAGKRIPIISAPHKDIGLKSDQLSQAVELL